MTSLSIHIPANSANTILTMPSIPSNEKTTTDRSHVTYSIVPKNPWRKLPSKLSSVDWDLNMNELEFE